VAWTSPDRAVTRVLTTAERSWFRLRRPATDSACYLDLHERWRSRALLTTNEWIHRRVESVVLRDRTLTERRLTVDFTIPRATRGLGRETRWLLPLVLLRKVPPVINIDLCDSGGRSRPLLTKRENAAITSRALAGMVQDVLRVAPTEDIRNLCDRMTRDDPRDAASAFDDLTSLVRQRAPEGELPQSSRRLVFVARAAVVNSIIWVPVDGQPGDRDLIKFSYEEPLEIVLGIGSRLGLFVGWRGLRLAFDHPHLRGTQAYHFELNVPDDVEIVTAQLNADVRDMRTGKRRNPEFENAMARDAHIYIDLADARPMRADNVAFLVRTSRRGFMSLAVSASGVIAGLLWTAFATRHGLHNDVAREVASPVLLVAPALLVAMVLRPDEHEFTTFLFTGTKYLVLLGGLAAGAAAGALAFAAEDTTAPLTAVWAITAGIATASFLTVTIGWVMGFPPPTRGALAMFVLCALGVIAAVVNLLAALSPLLWIASGIAISTGAVAGVIGEREPSSTQPSTDYTDEERARRGPPAG
jgi:hypothetical protein